MRQKQLLFSLILALFAILQIQAAVVPYLQALQSFGGTSVNTSTFTPTGGDYTLEVQGTSGTQISVAGGLYTYTPSTTGTIRFSQKSGSVYVYEGSVYKSTLTPDYSKLTYSASNILQNSGFENSTVVWTCYNSSNASISIPQGGTSGTSIRASTAFGSSYALIFHYTDLARYLTQGLSAGTVSSNSIYKIAFSYKSNTTTQGGAIFRANLGTTDRGYDISSTSTATTSTANTNVSAFTGYFRTSTINASNPVYFGLERVYGWNNTKIEWYDDFSLIRGTFTSGITGVGSASYLEGTAYSPENVVSYTSGDSYDMTSLITNPSFESDQTRYSITTLPGWTITNTSGNIQSQSNTPGQGWTKDGNIYAEKFITIGSTLANSTFYQTLTGLPNGKYSLKALGHAAIQTSTTSATYPSGSGVSIYATTNSITNSTTISTGADYTVSNIVVSDNNSLDIGYKINNAATGVNWAGVDNFRLYYYGPVSLTASQTSADLITTANTTTIDLTGANLTSDITITVPTHITLSGGNTSLTGTNTYTIASANANATNTITVTWDKTANVSGNISFTSGTVSKTVSVTTSDVESVAMADITLSAGGLNQAFAAGTTAYTAKAPADVNSITVNGATTPSIGTVTNSGTVISASSPSVILTGKSYNEANKTSDYTVTWGGNYTLSDWAANGSTDATLSIPTVYGWSATPSLTWIAANGSTTGTSCYVDFVSGENGANPTYTYNGANYTGRVLMMRWDDNSGRVYGYPVSLEKGTTYQFNAKTAYNSNAANGTLTFRINSAKDNSGTSYGTGGTIALGSVAGTLKDVSLIDIKVPSTGVYYLTVTSDNGAVDAIADLAINTQISESFTGSVDNIWSNAGNWSVRVPLAGDDITLPNGTMTIDQNAVAKTITVASGAKLSLSTGNTLTASSLNLQSDATGTATFVNNGAATITSATVNQYLTSGRNWYISSPVTNASVSSLSSAASVLRYDEPTAQFVTVNSGTLTPAVGYISTSTASTGAVSFTGVLNDGTVTVYPTRTYGVTKSGFNLIGNPYPSYLNWDQVSLSSNVSTTMWYRTKNAGNTAYVFDTYNPVGQVGTSNNGSVVTGAIPPMQAFWVRVAAPVLAHDTIGTVTFDNTMRTHKGASDLLMRAPAVQNSIQQVLRLQVSNGVNSDEAIVLFNPNASNGLDEYDSPKMSNNNADVPEIFTQVGTDNLVINGLNSVASNQEIQLGFNTGAPNTFTIRAAQLSKLDGTTVILRDNVNNTEVNLSNGDSLTFSSDIVASTTRFSLLFKLVGGTTEVDNREMSVQPKIILMNGKIYIEYTGIHSDTDRLIVFNEVGQKQLNLQLSKSMQIIDKLLPGVYLFNLSYGNKSISKKVVVR